MAGSSVTGFGTREAGMAWRANARANFCLALRSDAAGNGSGNRCGCASRCRADRGKKANEGEHVPATRSPRACGCDAGPGTACVWLNSLRLRGGYRESDIIRHYVLIMTAAPANVDEDELRQAVEVFACTTQCLMPRGWRCKYMGVQCQDVRPAHASRC